MSRSSRDRLFCAEVSNADWLPPCARLVIGWAQWHQHDVDISGRSQRERKHVRIRSIVDAQERRVHGRNDRVCRITSNCQCLPLSQQA